MEKEYLEQSLSNPDQAKRYKSALGVECTPISIDKDSGSGVFPSSSSGRSYRTTLDECTCPDFAMRNMPCKHIYRLAMELGVIDGDYSSYLHGGYHWRDAVDLIERYPDHVQQEFLDELRRTKKAPGGYRRKDNPDLELLIHDGIVEETGPRTPVFRSVRVIIDFFADYTKLCRYFDRKFCPPLDLVVDDDGNLADVASYPNDDVTRLLVERGFADPDLVRK